MSDRDVSDRGLSDGGVSDRGLRDRDDEPVIVACTDGPLLVRGAVRLESGDGDAIEPHRRTVALCRCGVSTIKPFCDGSHKAIHFTTDPVGTS